MKRTSIIGWNYAAFVTELKMRIQSPRLFAAQLAKHEVALCGLCRPLNLATTCSQIGG